MHGNKEKDPGVGNAIAKTFARSESASGDDAATTNIQSRTGVRSNHKKERETRNEMKKNRENERGEGKRAMEQDRDTDRALQRQSELQRAREMEKHTESNLKQTESGRSTPADKAHRVRNAAILTRRPIKLTRSNSLEDISLPRSKSLERNSERVPPARLRSYSPSPMLTVISYILHTH